MPKALLFARFRLKIALIALIGFLAAVVSSDHCRTTHRAAEESAQQSPSETQERAALTITQDRVLTENKSRWSSDTLFALETEPGGDWIRH